MPTWKTAFALVVFLAAWVLGGASAHAQTQYVYPGETYANTSLGASPTYQQQYPAVTATTYPMRQFPAANGVAYPTTQNQQLAQYQAPQNQQPAQYQTPQYQTQQYQTPQYQTAAATPQSYQPAPGPVDSSNVGQQLPSYQYNQQLDPRYQPPYNPNGSINAPGSAPDNNYGHPYWSLETRSGLDLTAQVAYYRYSESGVTETSDDPFLALNLRGTFAFWNGFFVTGEGRYGAVDVDYTGSGELDDRSVTTWEWRGLVGRDFLFQQFSLSPYAGFGYRTLFNDNRGITSTGFGGYRRYNQLYYLPFGIQPRTHIDSNARLTSTFEVDAVIHGVQKSDLSDVGGGDPDVRNVQSSGYGLRGDIMYETRTWAIGPYFMYWSIDDSETKTFSDNNPATCGGLGTPCTVSGIEPANHTIEAGVQFRYHFF